MDVSSAARARVGAELLFWTLVQVWKVRELISPDTFVSKVSLVENANIGWTGGPGGTERGRADGVVSDRRGGFYAVGEFFGKMQMPDSLLPSQGKGDGFLFHCDGSGKWLWGKTLGGSGEDRFRDGASSSQGNVIVVGTFNQR